MGGVDRVAGQQPFLRPGRRGDGDEQVAAIMAQPDLPAAVAQRDRAGRFVRTDPPAFDVVDVIETSSSM